MSSHRRRYAPLLSLLAAAGMTYFFVAILVPGSRATQAHPTVGRNCFGSDFYQVWWTSRTCLLQGRDPYSQEVTREIQVGIFGRTLSPSNPEDPPTDYRTFTYPAYVDFFGVLFAWLPFRTVTLVLVVLFSVLLAGSVPLWLKALRWKADLSLLGACVILVLSSYQGLEALYAVQTGILVSFLLAASVAALVKNRLGWAGCTLAFATVKPQVSLLLTAFLFMWTLAKWSERRRFAFSFLATLTALIASTLLIWPQWIARWLEALVKYARNSQPPLLPDIFGLYLGNILLLLTLAGTIWFAWKNRSVSSESVRFGLSVGWVLAVNTVTLLPEHAFYEQITLLPGILIIVRYGRMLWAQSSVSKWILVLGAGTLGWPWITAPVVILVQMTAPHLASALLFLPARMAVPLPFVVLGILFLIIRNSNTKEPLAKVPAFQT